MRRFGDARRHHGVPGGKSTTIEAPACISLSRVIGWPCWRSIRRPPERAARFWGQDPDGASGRQPGCLHPAIADLGNSGWGHQGDSRDNRAARGGRLRHRFGETVGVGQSEVAVANMVDTFVFLTLARTGDQLQGIKKGVLELADIVVVNKADGEHAIEAKAAARELAAALRLIYPAEALWRPPVLTMSARDGTGLAELWNAVLHHREVLVDAGEFDARRRAQLVDWTWSMVRDAVLDRLHSHPGSATSGRR